MFAGTTACPNSDKSGRRVVIEMEFAGFSFLSYDLTNPSGVF